MRWIVFEPCIVLILLLEILSVTISAKKIRLVQSVKSTKKPRAEAQTQYLLGDHSGIDSKGDFSDIEQYYNNEKFPPKVIQVTKTVAVHIPVAVPVERRPNDAQINPFTTVQPVTPTRRSTTPKPVQPAQPAKINSLEALNYQNSIWQQNFPPFGQQELKSDRSERINRPRPKKMKKAAPTLPSKPTALGEFPRVASILISQDPNTKAINIQIPGNAGMSDNFLEDVQKNPMTLLKSLNLSPVPSYGPSSPSSFDPPAAGSVLPSAFATSTTSFGRNPLTAETTDYSPFFTDNGYSESDLSTFAEFSNKPSFADYLAARQKYEDAISSSSNSTRYVKERPRLHNHHHVHQQSNLVTPEVQYKTHYRYKNQPIDPSQFRELTPVENIRDHGTSLFVGTFPKEDSRFAGSDVRATLREYEKRVEKEIYDSTGMHSMPASISVDAPTEYEPTITPLVPLPLVSEKPRRLRTLPTLSTPAKQKPREQAQYKIKIKKAT